MNWQATRPPLMGSLLAPENAWARVLNVTFGSIGTR
jgi:hypothetical protein